MIKGIVKNCHCGRSKKKNKTDVDKTVLVRKQLMFIIRFCLKIF